MTAGEVIAAYAAAWERGDPPAASARDAHDVVMRFADRHLELRRVSVYHVRDGRIVEIDISEADQYAVDEFVG